MPSLEPLGQTQTLIGQSDIARFLMLHQPDLSEPINRHSNRGRSHISKAGNIFYTRHRTLLLQSVNQLHIFLLES